MAGHVDFRPHLRPLTDGTLVPIKIKNPRGGLITIEEIDPATTTVGELKQKLHKRNRKFTVERQWYTYKPEDSKGQITLKNRFTLGSYKINAGDTIVFRDLGVHYPWKTEYLLETALLLSSYILFYAFHEAYRVSHDTYTFQMLMLGCWIFPHLLSILEIVLLGNPKRLAPFALTLKVALPHSVLAMITSYFINGPEYGPELSMLDPDLMWKCIYVFCGSHLVRFLAHLSRRNNIPYDFSYELAFAELVAWCAFFYMVQSWTVGLLFIGCTIWKHYIFFRIRSDNS